jgi:hypothetical protein
VPDLFPDHLSTRDEDLDIKEIVPEECAVDHPRLMLWPANKAEWKEAEVEVKIMLIRKLG